MFVAYPPCEGCQWLSSGQLSDQQSSPWLCSEPNWETILKAQETFAGVLSWLADWHVTIFWFVERVNWWVFVKCEPKWLKEPKTWTTSVCVHWIYLIHEFHNLSWITEINYLFHDILIYWDAPVGQCTLCHQPILRCGFLASTKYVLKRPKALKYGILP